MSKLIAITVVVSLLVAGSFGIFGYEALKDDTSDVSIDRQSPSVEFITPEENDILSGREKISIQWSDDGRLDRIVYYIDDVEVENGTSMNWRLDTAEFDDGDHVLKVEVVDRAGNVGTTSIDLSFDNAPNQPPVIAFGSGEEWYETLNGITITVEDIDGQVSEIYGYIDSDPVNIELVSAGVYFVNTEDLDEGMHTLDISAKDDDGSAGTASMWFGIDGADPEITFIRPKGEYVSGTVDIELQGTDNVGIAEYLIWIDGEEVHAGDSEYTWTPGTDGMYTIRAYAVDNAGNRVFEEITVIVDNEPPEIEIDSPDEGDWLSGTVNVQYEVTDDNEVQETKGYVDGTLVHTGPGSWTLDTTNFGNGIRTIKIVARDAAKNSRSLDIEVGVDNKDPVVEITSPEADDLVTGTVDIEVDASDNDEITSLEVFIDGVLVGETESFQWDSTSVNDGSRQITARVEDRAGNVANDVVWITVDNEDPAVEITTPEDASLHAGDILIEIEAEDDVSVEEVKCYLDGSLLFTGSQHTWDSTEVEDGDHELKAVAEDGAGHTAEHVLEITIDNTAPTIELITPEEDETLEGDVEVEIDAEDASDITDVKVYVDSTKVSEELEFTLDTTEFADGDRILKVIVEDEVGNVATEEYDIYIDNVFPLTVGIISPAESEWLSGTSFIDGDVEDDENDITEIKLFVDGDEVASGLNEDFDLDTTEYDDGEHTIKIWARDDAGYTNSSEVVVNFDNTAPSVELTSPEDTTVNDTVTFEIEVEEEGSGVANIVFTIDDKVISEGLDTSVEWNSLVKEDDMYTLFVDVEDNVENVEQLEVEIYVNNKVPAFTLSPLNNSHFRKDREIIVDCDDSDIEYICMELDGDEVCRDTVGEWLFETEDYDDGEWWMNITVEDWGGDQTSIEYRYAVDNTPPEIEFVAPLDYYISGEVDIETHASDNFLVATVELGVEDISQNSTSEVLTWDTEGYDEGEYEVEAVVTDKAGNWADAVRSYFIDNTPPTVSITNPEHGEKVEGTVTVTVDAYDGVLLDKAHFYVDSQLLEIDDEDPYSFSWDSTSVPDGNYTMEVEVFDAAGNFARDSIRVKVGDEPSAIVTEPTVKVLSPYDVDGVERIVLTDEETDYQGLPVIASLARNHGVTPSADWSADSDVELEIDFTSLADYSGRIALSYWTAPNKALVVDSYSNLLRGAPIASAMDIPLLYYGSSTDEALWKLGTVHASDILVIGDTPYNAKGAQVIEEADALETALGIWLNKGITPSYIVATNPNDVSANTDHQSAFAGTFAAHYGGLMVLCTNSATDIYNKVQATYSLMDDYEVVPEHLCIVGDHISMPFTYENHGFGNEPSDNKYADRDGDAHTLEVAVGRVLAKTLPDLSYYLDRIINYESYLDTTNAPIAPSPRLMQEFANNAVIYMGWAAEFAEDSENHCRESLRLEGWFNTQDDTDVAHAMMTSQLMRDFANSSFIVINADHGMPTGTVTFDSGDLLDLHPGISFGVSCSVGRIDGVNKENSLTYTFLEKGTNAWFAPTRTAYGSWVQTYPYQPIAAPGLCYLYIRDTLGNDHTTGRAYMEAKNGLIAHSDSNVNKGTVWQYVLYGDPGFNPYEPCNEGWF